MTRAILLPMLFLPVPFVALASGTASQSGVRPAPQPVELARNGDHVDVRIGGRPFTTYYFDPSVAKPYFLGSSRVDLQACKLEYSIVSPK